MPPAPPLHPSPAPLRVPPPGAPPPAPSSSPPPPAPAPSEFLPPPRGGGDPTPSGVGEEESVAKPHPTPPRPDRFPRLNRRLPFSPDRWQLECERFGVALSRPRPPLVPRDEPHPLADAIPLAIQSLRISDALQASRIADDWTTIVGQNLARLTSPGKIEGSTLYVRVAHPLLLPEFQGPLAAQILARLRARFPATPVTRLHPRVE